LYFDDVAFGVAGVDGGEGAGGAVVADDEAAELAAAVGEQALESVFDGGDMEGQMPEPLAVDGRRNVGVVGGFVGEYFEGGAAVTAAGQTEVDAGDPGAGNGGDFVEPVALEVALGVDGRAAEDVAVEAGQLPPIAGDEVGMDVSGAVVYGSPLPYRYFGNQNAGEAAVFIRSRPGGFSSAFFAGMAVFPCRPAILSPGVFVIIVIIVCITRAG
jgi:hypothetical protein